MTTTFCVSGAALIKAGAGISSTILAVSSAALIADEFCVDTWINDAESLINVLCRYDFITAYPSLTSGAKLILRGITSDLAAINCIGYDMSGYTSRVEAEDMINVLRDSALRGMSIIKDKNFQKFITDPTTGTV